ncbi:MAG: hypothetical protein P4L33_02280 [Capsulimonadaceae bacterium]|nr:hypothetical protein [Capsulimonadaceae bacterium]
MARFQLMLALTLMTAVWSVVPADASVITSSVNDGASPIILKIANFKDSGGLTGTPSADPVNLQLTRGLAKYIQRGLPKNAQVVIAGAKDARKDLDIVGAAYDLEGDVSHVASPLRGGGPYLVVLRLFKEGAQRDLLGQWAGVARTYLDLTTNVVRDKRVAPEGLVGGLGNCVLMAVTGTPVNVQSTEFALAMEKAMAPDLIAADIVPEATSQVTPDPTTLRSGDRYRVKISSREHGNVYLVGIDASGNPSAVDIEYPGNEIQVDADHPALLPVEPAIQTGSVLVPTDRRLVVLIRRTPAPSVPAVQKMSFVVANPQPQPQQSDDSDRPSTRPAVEILDCGVAAIPSSTQTRDADVERILKMVATDPAGTWIGKEIAVHILPAVATPSN